VRQFAVGGSGEDGVEVALQFTPSVFHYRCGKRCYVAGKTEGSIQPELETHADKVAAVLLNKAGLAVEMGKASLVVQPMSLLAGIVIRYPHVRLVAGRGVSNDLGGAAEHGGMDDGIGRAEHPLIAVAAFDPHSGFVADYNIGTAQGLERIVARMKSLACVDLLILDDWGLEPLDGNARNHLLETLEDRYGHRSTLGTSQTPVARWYEMIGDPTFADAILDRFVHNAHRIELTGDSMRRQTSAEAD
jgi:hypothetical protein